MNVNFTVIHDARKCVFCNDCVESCSSGAIIMQEENIITWDKNICYRCESCTDICDNNAIKGVWK